MNGDLPIHVGFLDGNSNLGFKQSWKKKINVWQRGDSPVVDPCDTTGKTAGVCSFILESVSLSAQDALCQTRTQSLKEEEVSPLWHFCSVTTNAAFARWPVMDKEAIQYTSFLVPLVL